MSQWQVHDGCTCLSGIPLHHAFPLTTGPSTTDNHAHNIAKRQPAAPVTHPRLPVMQDYWAAIRARDAEEAARAAARREVADQMYQRVKREVEERGRAREHEEELLNLLRQASGRWVCGCA